MFHSPLSFAGPPPTPGNFVVVVFSRDPLRRWLALWHTIVVVVAAVFEGFDVVVAVDALDVWARTRND
jgi:hypothetical protein